MEAGKTISTSKVRLELDGTKADEKYDLWELRRTRVLEPSKRYVSCEETFEIFRGKACVRGMIRGPRVAYAATKHGLVAGEALQAPENTTIRRIHWNDLDECDALRMLLSCLADRSDESKRDDWTRHNLDGALRQTIEVKDKNATVITLEHSITREGDSLVWNADVKTFTLASHLRDRDFSKRKPKETYPRFMLNEGKRITWANRKDKTVNDDNSYLLRVRKGRRSRNMVDALSFNARETKDGKLASLWNMLRMFDLFYGGFAKLEWLRIPRKGIIPINVMDKKLRKADGNVAVDGLDDCGREADEVRQALYDVKVTTNGRPQARIMLIHDADHYKPSGRGEEDAADPYRQVDRSIPTQCVSVEAWNKARMRKTLVTSVLNELRIKQEIISGSTTDPTVFGYSFAVPYVDEEDQEPLETGEEKYMYLTIDHEGRFEFYKDAAQPSLGMWDFMQSVWPVAAIAENSYGIGKVECVIRNPEGNVAAIVGTSIHTMPSNLDNVIKETGKARSETGLPRSEKTAHPRSREFIETNYLEMTGINIGEDDDGTTLYSIGYQSTNLNKRMPRMVPIRRIIQIEGERFDEQIIDMCNVAWVRDTYLPSVLPWPVKYLREMDRNKLRQS